MSLELKLRNVKLLGQVIRPTRTGIPTRMAIASIPPIKVFM
jgi:hypothetical protein